MLSLKINDIIFKFGYEFNDIHIKLDENFIFDKIPTGTVGIIAGIGGVGKSYFVLEKVILSILSEKYKKLNEYIGIDTNFKDCFYISYEDNYVTINNRIHNIIVTNFISYNGGIPFEWDDIKKILTERFHIVGVENNKDPLASSWIFKSIKPNSLIIYDTLSSSGKIDQENSNDSVSTYITRLKELASYLNSGILLIHHLRKEAMNKDIEVTADSIRGGSALVDNCRYAAILMRSKDDNKYMSYIIKKNNGGECNTRLFRGDFWQSGFKPKDIDFKRFNRGRDVK